MASLWHASVNDVAEWSELLQAAFRSRLTRAPVDRQRRGRRAKAVADDLRALQAGAEVPLRGHALVDDRVENLDTGARLGMATVLFGAERDRGFAAAVGSARYSSCSTGDSADLFRPAHERALSAPPRIEWTPWLNHALSSSASNAGRAAPDGAAVALAAASGTRSSKKPSAGSPPGPGPLRSTLTRPAPPPAHLRDRVRPASSPCRPDCPRSTGCSAVVSSPGRFTCSAASPASASRRCCYRSPARSPREASGCSTYPPKSRCISCRPGRAVCRSCTTTCGRWPRATSDAIVEHIDEMSIRLSSSSTPSRPSPTPQLSSTAGSVAQVRQCAHRLAAARQVPRCAAGAGGPRHQRRHAGRASGARTSCRHGAFVRRRPPPCAAAVARGQASLRRHQRARRLRNAAAGPDSCRGSEPAVPRGPGADQSRARCSCRSSTGTGRSLSRCKRSSTHPNSGPAARPKASMPVGSAFLLAVLGERAGVAVSADRDVYALAVGGVDASEPGADLAVCFAVASGRGRCAAGIARGLRRGRPRRRAASGQPSRATQSANVFASVSMPSSCPNTLRRCRRSIKSHPGAPTRSRGHRPESGWVGESSANESE